MTTTPNAGSAVGIDLASLEQLALAATPGPWIRLFGERTLYDQMEDGCRGNPIVRADTPFSAHDANNLDFIAAANPAAVLELIALARATPQPSADRAPADGAGEPKDVTTLRRWAEQVDRLASTFTDERSLLCQQAAVLLHRIAYAPTAGDSATPQHPEAAPDEIEQRTEKIRLAHANPVGRSLAHLIRDVEHLLAHIALLRSATPQHSVAEQDDPCSAGCQMNGTGDPQNDCGTCTLARPLASTAAAQPEQASIKTWQERSEAAMGTATWYPAGHYKDEEIADLRAALAIPASTAPTQQENEKANVLPPFAAPAGQHDANESTEARNAVRSAIAQALSGVYYCGRVWSAWGVGTMSENDFTPAAKVDAVLDEITDAAIYANRGTTYIGGGA